MAIVVDTSVIVTLDRSGATLDDLRDASPSDEVFITSIGVSELLVGVHRSETTEQQQRRRDFVEALITEIPVLSFDLTVARIHAVLVTELMTQGRLIGSNDIQIAATAVAYGFDVLTENVVHFERISGLAVHRPDW